MKKILSILAAVGLTATTGSAVVACSHDKEKPFAELNADELKAEITKIYKNVDELSKEARDPGVTKERQKELGELIGTINFNLLEFITRVFLETNYMPFYKDINKGGIPDFKLKKDDAEYNKQLQFWIEKMISISEEKDPEGKFENQIKNLKDNIEKLTAKLPKDEK